MKYTDLVQLIRTNYSGDLEDLLWNSAQCVVEGGMRRVFLFDRWVVKICSVYPTRFESTNHIEYENYCKHLTGQSNIPIIFTRLYFTKNHQAVLIQERMVQVVDLFGSSLDRNFQKKHYQKIPFRLIRAMVKEKKIKKRTVDSWQCGIDKRGQLKFFDHTWG